MKYTVNSVLCSGPGFSAPNLDYGLIYGWRNDNNRLSPCEWYQQILEASSDSELLIYAHDDVTIHDTYWLPRVMAEFDSHPNCVVVGLGGALALGHPDLYKRPYRLQDMARYGYRSNQTDYAVHGEREIGSCRVAVLDAFFMAVRRDFLLQVGGWPVKHISHHCIDTWIACEAARRGKEVRMVGVSCTHHGGGTSVKPIYGEAKWLQGGTLSEDHRLPHKWLYEEYRGTLPFQVKP